MDEVAGRKSQALPYAATSAVRSPSSMSNAVTPASTYVSPCMMLRTMMNVNFVASSGSSRTAISQLGSALQTSCAGSSVIKGGFVLTSSAGNTSTAKAPTNSSSIETPQMAGETEPSAQESSEQRNDGAGHSASTVMVRVCVAALLPSLSSHESPGNSHSGI